MAEALVTVLVPVYNTEAYLLQCLDALAAQTLKDIAFICIDDGSTDSSPAILAEYAKADPRFNVITKPNSGYGASMNIGLDAVGTKYVGIVEPDDIPATDMFEKLVELAESANADVVKSNYYEHRDARPLADDELMENLDPTLPYGRPFSPAEHPSVLNASASIWSCLFRKSHLDREGIRFLETPGASFQDTSFNLMALTGAKTVALTREGFLHYRVDNSASSVKAGDKVFYICDEYARVWDFLNARPRLHARFAKHVATIQFRGYCWNQWRLARKFREQFFDRFHSEYRALSAEGLLQKDLFNEQEWSDVCQLVNEPGTFFMRACGARGINKTVIASVEPHVTQKEFEQFAASCPADEEIIVDFPNGASFDIWPVAETDYRIKVLSEMCSDRELDDSDIRGESLRRVTLKHSDASSPFGILKASFARIMGN